MSELRVVIGAPFDAHVHFRQGDLMSVVRHHDRLFEYALAMPNTDPPILTAADAVAYGRMLAKHRKRLKFLLTIKLTPTTTPDVLQAAAEVGVVAAKLYPEGVTTNSHGGFTRRLLELEGRSEVLYPLCEAMERLGLVLCLHGEMPAWPEEEDFCLDREVGFLRVVHDLATRFPSLRIVMEHITTERALGLVDRFPNVACTITYHHLLLTLNDVVGDKIQPHNFCKPLAKRPSDRDALLAAATSRRPRVFLGSDSAPHLRGAKEGAEGCAGCFTAPFLLEGLADVFHQVRALDSLEHFASEEGRRWYGLPGPSFSVALERHEGESVPEEVDGCVPFRAGQRLPWRAEVA